MNDNIEFINIKNIKNKYDIYLNKQIGKINNIFIYEGKNLLNKKKIIIDVYTHEILCFAKRIINKMIILNHKNLVNIIDIIIDNSYIYIIKEYFDETLLNIDFDVKYILELINCIKFLYDRDIYIENFKITDIFITNNTIKISPKFIESKPNKKILYGSPLFSPQNHIYFLKNDKEDLIIKNIGMIILQFYTKKFINNDIKKNILTEIDETFPYYNLLTSIFLDKNKISLDDLLFFFNKNMGKKKNNNECKSNDDLFVMEM